MRSILIKNNRALYATKRFRAKCKRKNIIFFIGYNENANLQAIYTKNAEYCMTNNNFHLLFNTF